jgi:hypothetical protein
MNMKHVHHFLLIHLNMFIGHPAAKFIYFYFIVVPYSLILLWKVVASLNRLRDLLLESSRSPAKFAKRKDSFGFDSRNRSSTIISNY